jgi:hypothetical protein
MMRAAPRSEVAHRPAIARAPHVHVAEVYAVAPGEPAAELCPSHGQAQHARRRIAGEDFRGRVVPAEQLAGRSFTARRDRARCERHAVWGTGDGTDAIDDRILTTLSPACECPGIN